MPLNSLFSILTRKKSKSKSKNKSKSKSKSNSFTKKRNNVARTFITNIRATIKRRKTLDNLMKSSSAQKIQKTFKTTLVNATDDNVCAICYSNILYPNSSYTTTLPCGHKFHTKCIKAFIAKSDYPKCPLCRAPIPINNMSQQTSNQTIRVPISRTSQIRNRRRVSQSRLNNLHAEWQILLRARTAARTRMRQQRTIANKARRQATNSNIFNRNRLRRIAENEEATLSIYRTELQERSSELLRFERRHSDILTQIITRTPNQPNDFGVINDTTINNTTINNNLSAG